MTALSAPGLRPDWRAKFGSVRTPCVSWRSFRAVFAVFVVFVSWVIGGRSTVGRNIFSARYGMECFPGVLGASRESAPTIGMSRVETSAHEKTPRTGSGGSSCWVSAGRSDLVGRSHQVGAERLDPGEID
jgi:hypothetical protein